MMKTCWAECLSLLDLSGPQMQSWVCQIHQFKHIAFVGPGKALLSKHLPTATTAAAAAAKSLQSCLTLRDPVDGSPPGSSVPGILQARILEWVAISFSNACMHAKSLQSCPTLHDPIDGSPPGSSVPGILQARILEWVPHYRQPS